MHLFTIKQWFVVTIGLEANDYIVFCYLNVTDIYGGVSHASATAQVLTPQTTNATETSNALKKQLSQAADSNNNNLIAQIVGATSTAINVKNCSVPVDCKSLNRNLCSLTARTCGACYDGYYGVFGDSNTLCKNNIVAADFQNYDYYNNQVTSTSTSTSASNTISSYAAVTAAQCNVDNDCNFGTCDQHTCVPYQKDCPSDCSGNGECRYYNAINLPISQCSALDSYCRATCICNLGFYGKDCSHDQEDFDAKIAIREQLCSSLYNSIPYQDVSDSGAIVSRMASIMNTLVDITQVSPTALDHCTETLIATIKNGVSVIGLLSPSAQFSIVNAINAVSTVFLFLFLFLFIIELFKNI